MSEFFEKDPRWDIYNINSKEEYENLVVVKGFFHGNMPEDVVKEFRTSEYLMAHGWYYWLFWDEAFAKCLFILEMAIKLKAKALGIKTEERKKNGKLWNRRLVDIINDICTENHHDMLKAYLHRARDLRNTIAHPEQHSFSGPHGLDRNIKHFVITLNRLFREEDWFIRQRELREKIRMTIKNWSKKPILVIKNNSGIVFSAAQALETVDEHLMITLVQALDVSKIEGKNIQPDPMSYMIKDVQIKEGKLIGKDNNGHQVLISTSESPEAINAVNKSNEYLKQFSKEEQETGKYYIESTAPWQLVNLEYEYLQDLYTKN